MNKYRTKKERSVLVTGANGQLGQDLCQCLEAAGWSYSSYTSKELDITNQKQVREIIARDHPDVIYHCAAYTNVEGAEVEGYQRNIDVNVEGTLYVAQIAREISAILVYISTDYVFDGTKKEDYVETDEPKPINQYGRAKRLGEQIALAIVEKCYVVRTSWLFGANGNNFVTSMLKLSQKHKTLKVIDDQIGKPTWTRDLAAFLLYLIEKETLPGIYQFANEGKAVSWYEFASEILKDKEVSVIPIQTSSYPQVAKRPPRSCFSLFRVKATNFFVEDWDVALGKMLSELKE